MEYDDPVEAFTIVLRHNNREFAVRDEFNGRITLGVALFIWEDGNNSCDCNRSLMIRTQCDPAFPELPCGDTIEMVGDPCVELAKPAPHL